MNLPRWLDRSADAAMSVARNTILARGVVVSGWAFWPIFALLGLELLISAGLLHFTAARRRNQRSRATCLAVAISLGLVIALGLGWLSTRSAGGLGGPLGIASYLVLRLFGWIREILHAPIGEDGLPETRFGLQNGFHLLGLILFAFVVVLGQAKVRVIQIGFFVLRAAAEVAMAFAADALFATKPKKRAQPAR